MNLPTAIASSTILRRQRRRRRARSNREILESRRLLAGAGVPNGMDLGQASWFYQNAKTSVQPATTSAAIDALLARGELTGRHVTRRGEAVN